MKIKDILYAFAIGAASVAGYWAVIWLFEGGLETLKRKAKGLKRKKYVEMNWD